MSGMLELGSSRCLNLTAEFKFEKKQIQTVKMAVCSHLNFSSNFGGFSRRALIIEKRVQKPEQADYLFQR